MKRFCILLMLMCCFVTGGALAQDSMSLTAQFQSANQLYTSGDYETALAAYLTLEKSGVRGGDLYYNIGNSYYKLEQLAKAILYYERARKFLPMDEDLLTNLQLANLSIVDKITPIPELFYQRYWRSFKYMLSFSSLRTTGYFFYLGMGILTALWILVRKEWIRRLFKPALVILFLGALVSFRNMISIHNEWNSRNTGIIQAEEIQVRGAPADNGTDLFSLHEGTKVWIKRRSGEWMEIRIADGKTGWIKMSSMEII